MNKNNFIDDVAVKFLTHPTNKEMLDANSRGKLEAGALKLEDAEYVIRKEVTGKAGMIDLILPSDVEKRGVLDINAAKLPALENLVLDRIRVGYAKHATETNPAALKYTSLQDDGTTVVDTALLNARLIVSQDEKPIVNLPLSSFFSEALERTSIGDSGYKFKNYRLVKADSVFKVQIHFPEGSTVNGTSKHHIEVRLCGAKTRVK